MAVITNYSTNPNLAGFGPDQLEVDVNTDILYVAGRPRVSALSTGASSVRMRSAVRPAGRGVGAVWSAVMRLTVQPDTPIPFQLAVVFYDGGGATLASYGGAPRSIKHSDGSVELYAQGLEPSGTARVGFVFTRIAGLTTDVFYPGRIGLYDTAPALPAENPTSSPLTWFWNGSADSSTSYTPITSPNLTPFVDMAPCPRVQIEFGTFVPGTERVTIMQVAEGVPRPVAGAENILAAGGVVKVDYYPPLNSEVSYYAEMFDADGGSLGRSNSSTTVVPFIGTVLSSPTDPRLSIEVDLDESFASSLEEGFTGQVHQIGDRRILLATSGYGLDNLDVSFWTDTLQQYRTAVQILRDAKGLIVIRTSYRTEVSPVLYVWVPKSKRIQTDLPGGSEEFKFENAGSEVDPPTARVIFSPITYRLFHAAYPTYRAFRNAYDTYRTALLNPPAEV